MPLILAGTLEFINSKCGERFVELTVAQPYPHPIRFTVQAEIGQDDDDLTDKLDAFLAADQEVLVNLSPDPWVAGGFACKIADLSLIDNSQAIAVPFPPPKMPQDWSTFIHTREYPDGEGTYTDIILAPDADTSLRIFSKNLHESNGTRLDPPNCDSDGATLDEDDDAADTLLGYAQSLVVQEESVAGAGTLCPSCTSNETTQLTELPIDLLPLANFAQHGIHVCNTCGYQWAALGHHEPTRTAAIEAAKIVVAGLDQAEIDLQED